MVFRVVPKRGLRPLDDLELVRRSRFSAVDLRVLGPSEHPRADPYPALDGRDDEELEDERGDEAGVCANRERIHAAGIAGAFELGLNETVGILMERVTIDRNGFVHLAAASAVRTHASQAYKLVIGVDTDVEVHVDGECARARAILVAPNVVHSMRARGVAVACFAEPGAMHVPYRADDTRIVIPSSAIAASLRSLATGVVRGRAVDDSSAAAEAYGLLRLEGPSRVDRRVEQALVAVAADPDASFDRIALAQRLSSTRLRHLVRESTGLSLRRHRLWHRTLAATEHVVQGAMLTQAAADAGFADLAHFTRSFAGFFGRTPSSIGMPAAVLRSYAQRL